MATKVATKAKTQVKKAGKSIKDAENELGLKEHLGEIKDAANDAGRAAKDAALDAKAQLALEIRKAQAKLKQAQTDMEKYIAENPKKSAAIAAAVGAAIGAGLTAAIMRRRNK